MCMLLMLVDAVYGIFTSRNICMLMMLVDAIQGIFKSSNMCMLMMLVDAVIIKHFHSKKYLYSNDAG